MRIVVLAVLFALLSGAASAQQTVVNCAGGICTFTTPQPAYTHSLSDLNRPTFCQNALDCTHAVDHCGRQHPVNQAHKSQMQSYFDAQDASASCDWIEKRPVMEDHCVGNSCAVVLDNYAQ